MRKNLLVNLIRCKKMNLTSFTEVKKISGSAMVVKKMEVYVKDAKVVKQTLDAILIRFLTCVL